MARPAFNVFNIFTHQLDPGGALAELKRLLPEAQVEDRPDGGWELVAEWKRGWLKKSLTLTVRSSPDYYTGDGWNQQIQGMEGYFRRFPTAFAQPEIFGYLRGLKYCASFVLDPDPVDDDPREEIMFQMARFMDGILFLPGCLLDAEGRTLIALEGESDPEAKLPDHVPVEAALVDETRIEGEMPTVERMTQRLILMSTMVNRGFLEDCDPEEKPENHRRDDVALLKDSAAWDEAEPWEREALEAPVGSLEKTLGRKLQWQSEGALTLAWALNLAELPPYDKQVDVNQLYGLAKELREGKLQPRLRSEEELETVAFQWLAIHWRIRQFSLDGKEMDFVGYAPKSWCGAMDLSAARILERDLAIGDVPIVKAPEEAWQSASGNLEERRTALQWVLGQSPVYSETDTST